MTVSSQFLQLVTLIGSGIAIAAVIDGVRVLKASISRQSLLRRWIGLMELSVWVLLGIATYALLFVLKQGAWRGIDPIAQVLGILLYQLLFQRPIRFIGRIIWLFIVRPVWLIIYSILSGIRVTFSLFAKIIKFIFSPVFKICNKIVRTTLKKR